MSWRGYAASVLLVGLLLPLTAGCSSDGSDPAPATTSKSSPTGTPPSPSQSESTTQTPTIPATPSVATTGPNVRPGEKPPVLNAVGKTNTRPGAATFAYFWFRALDWGYATTDSTLAKSLYSRQCADCARFVSIFDRVRASGQHFSGGRVTLLARSLVSDDDRHPGSTVVDVTIAVAKLTTLTDSGKSIAVNPMQKSLTYRLWCAWSQPGGWSLLDYKRVVT